jgi:hypothetical protein
VDETVAVTETLPEMNEYGSVDSFLAKNAGESAEATQTVSTIVHAAYNPIAAMSDPASNLFLTGSILAAAFLRMIVN